MIKGSELQNRKVGDDEDLAALAQRLRALEARIARARVAQDTQAVPCADCWRKGRDAALKIIDER